MDTVEQLKAARGALDLTRKALAVASGVSPETVKRMEGGTGPIAGNASSIRAIRTALEARGVIFLPENGGPPGVRFGIPATCAPD